MQATSSRIEADLGRRAVLTPRGEAVRALIHAGWLRELAPGAQTAAIHGLVSGSRT